MTGGGGRWHHQARAWGRAVEVSGDDKDQENVRR